MGLSPVTRLRQCGLDYGVQAALLGLNPATLRRWEKENGLDAYAKLMLTTFADACERDLDLAESVEHKLMERGVLYALYDLLSAALSKVDT